MLLTTSGLRALGTRHEARAEQHRQHQHAAHAPGIAIAHEIPIAEVII